MEVTEFRIRGVIFDLDGTLINSHAAMMRAYERWAEEFSINLDLLPQFLGMPNYELSRALLPPGEAEVAAARIEVLECTDTDGVVALPGAVDGLQALPTGSVAVGTSCTMDLMTARMTAAKLPIPSVTVTRDQVSNGKPDPETFLTACERMGYDPADVLVFEDAPAGIAAAKSAGCPVVGILSTQTAEVLKADAHVPDLSHVSWQPTDDGHWAVQVHSS